MSLYNELRPLSLEDMEGDHSGLATIFQNPDHNHSFLFTGPVGCGKTTAALIIQKMLDIHEYDVHRIGCDEKTGIDKVREFLGDMYNTPMSGGAQLFLLDEAHRLSSAAQNALLVPLEFVPKTVYFILCSSEPDGLLPGIRSRCYTERFPPLTDEQLLSIIRLAVVTKGLSINPSVFPAIITAAQGSARTALTVLESLVGVPKEIQAKKVQEYALVTDSPEAIELCRALYGKDDWGKISKLLDKLYSKKEGPERIRRMILSYGQTILLKGMNSNAMDIMQCFAKNYFDTDFAGLVISCSLVFHRREPSEVF